MNIPNEMAKLIINNAEIISEANNKLDKIDNNFYQTIKNIIKDKVEAKKWEWYEPKNYLQFMPSSWPICNNEYLVYYELGWYGKKLPWLLHAMGIKNHGLGFVLMIELSLKNECIENITRFYKKNQKYLTGAVLKHCYEKNTCLFFPCNNLENLADFYPQWKEYIEESVSTALDNLFNAHETIDKFITELAKKNKNS